MRDANITRESYRRDDDEGLDLFAAALCVLIPLVGWMLVLVAYLAWTYWV